MTRPPTWCDAEHQQTDLTLVLPVSEALLLASVLPRLVQVLDAAGARSPAERESRRELHAVDLLVERLHEALRPFDVPANVARPEPAP